jgi:hypothetical protein
MWGALSDEKTGRSFARDIVSNNKCVVSITIYILHVIKFVYIRVQHIQGLCQSRLSRADHGLSFVAPATIVV